MKYFLKEEITVFFLEVWYVLATYLFWIMSIAKYYTVIGLYDLEISLMILKYFSAMKSKEYEAHVIYKFREKMLILF